MYPHAPSGDSNILNWDLSINAFLYEFIFCPFPLKWLCSMCFTIWKLLMRSCSCFLVSLTPLACLLEGRLSLSGRGLKPPILRFPTCISQRSWATDTFLTTEHPFHSFLSNTLLGSFAFCLMLLYPPFAPYAFPFSAPSCDLQFGVIISVPCNLVFSRTQCVKWPLLYHLSGRMEEPFPSLQTAVYLE